MIENNKITTYILTGNNNYVPWARSVEIGLGGKGKRSFINGSKGKPKPKDQANPTDDELTAIENWETTDQMIMSWLLSTMDTKISSALMYCKTSKEIWTKAKTRYGQGKNFAHIFSLKQELSNIKQGNLNNSDLVAEILTKWEELQMYLPETINPEEIYKRNEHELIYTYLGALDSSFEPIRAQILSSAEMPQFDDVVLKIEQEESRRRLMNPSPAPSTDNQAFRATYNKDRGKGNLWCDHCKRSSHNKESCWVLHPHLKPQRKGGGSTNNGGWRREAHSAIGELNSGTNTKADFGMNGMNPNPSQGPADHGPPGFYGTTAAGPVQDPISFVTPAGPSGPNSDQLMQLVNQLNQLLQPRQQNSGLSELKLSNNSIYLNKHDSNWIIDSGATHHMSCSPNNFLNLITSNEPQFVTTANGGQTKIFGTGTISVFNKPVNEDIVSGEMIGEGILRNGLYYLQQNNKCFVSIFREHEPFFTPTQDTTAATPSTLQFLFPSLDDEENPSASSSGGDYEDERNNTEDRQEEEGEDTIRRRSTRTRQPSTRLRDFVSHQVLYPIQNFINYNKVSPTYQIYLSKLDGNNEPNTYDEAKQQTIWIQAMNEELKALEQNNTWDMVELPKGKKPVGCKWVYKIKYNSDGTVERYKARLVAKGFTQTYGIDYQETFAPVAKMNTFRILMSVATNHGWDLFQMDVKNAFLQGDLEEEVYMTPPPGYFETSKVCKLRKAIYGLKQSPRAWYAKLSTFLTENNFKKSTADCSVFIRKNVSIVSQFMHAPRTCHMEAINRILRYLKGTPGQGILMKQNSTNTVVGFSDADWAGSCDRKSTTGFCTFVGGNLVTWKSKKQNVVARSSAEAEYRAMASTASELIWIKHLLHDMQIECSEPIQMFCDNQAARHIASNPVFHERTKHIEVDCHFIRDKVQSKEIEIPFIRSQEQLADIFTKALDKKTSQQILSKLGAHNLFEPNLRGSIEGLRSELMASDS
ncbi:copia-like protein [Cucumis melo var. makuwa]|uniref:Copia-like protein n=2 Tax=Cucumis melo var. makuwa TaxID=1194695 RepID=A0A5D3DP15_CUCMM|nr:copia-like protein [Cucumis melo var. makuwa]TYK25285.1 copia-like protein [Cucumis melo var. makuwa]